MSGEAGTPDPLSFSPEELAAMSAELQQAERQPMTAQKPRQPGTADQPAAGSTDVAVPKAGGQESREHRQALDERSRADKPGKTVSGSAKPFAAAVEAARREVVVREWIRDRRRMGLDNLNALARQKGEAFAAEVARQLSPAAKAKTIQAIHAASKRRLRQDLKDEGIEFVAIDSKDERIRSAVASLVQQMDAGRKPSALAAAQQPGLDIEQAKKLAYKVPVKREAADAGICLAASSQFVIRLRQEQGLLDMVIAPHARLSALARVMGNARKVLASLPGSRTISTTGKSPRGWWHAKAIELRRANKTVNQIANLLDQKDDTVKKLLKRRGLLGAEANTED